MSRTQIPRVLLPLLLLGAAALNAQTKADQELIKQARSLYYSHGSSRPAYIACDDTMDWGAIAKELNAPQGEGTQQALKSLNAMKITFVTRNATHTDVTVTGDKTHAEQMQKVEEQIKVFFRAYWSISYGRLLPKAETNFEVASTPDGYLVTQQLETGRTTTLQMDKSFLITKAISIDRANMSHLELRPTFGMENDGVLHPSGVSVDYKLGQSRLLYEYNFDYQLVGGFYVPEHVKIFMPGALSFVHTFKNCQVLDKNSAPAPSEPETVDPRD
jgi:hypothetical protein